MHLRVFRKTKTNKKRQLVACHVAKYTPLDQRRSLANPTLQKFPRSALLSTNKRRKIKHVSLPIALLAQTTRRTLTTPLLQYPLPVFLECFFSGGDFPDSP